MLRYRSRFNCSFRLLLLLLLPPARLQIAVTPRGRNLPSPQRNEASFSSSLSLSRSEVASAVSSSAAKEE